jgi:TatD DNase family protein
VIDPATLVDTHCHLDARQFAGESVDDILQRARQRSVTTVVTIGTDLESSRRAAAIAAAHSGVFAAVGVDPSEADSYDDATEEELSGLASEPQVVAIGEIGLDYHWDRAPRPVQARTFERQLSLAVLARLPVVIHSRDARDDTTAILESWSRTHPWSGERPLGIMHCFDGDPEWAERLVAAGMLISFAGNVTYPNAHQLHATARSLPDDAFVLETDSPYLAPQPVRGRRNEPANVEHTAAFLAQLRDTTLEKVARHTTANARRGLALIGDFSTVAP